MLKLKNKVKNILKNTGILLLFLSLIIPFQNCAKKPAVFEDSKVSETLSYFEFRYLKAAPVYFEVQIVPTSSDATTQFYDLLGFAAPSDGSSVNLEYSIEVFAPDKSSVCPVKTGVLPAGQTLITETCSMLKSKILGYAVMKIRQPLGEWFIYTKTYAN